MEPFDSPTQQTPGSALRKLRLDRGLTVDQIAFLAGVNKATISRYERGIHELNSQAIVNLSKALKVSVKKVTG